MADSISVISERLIPRRPASNLHPATSGCTDTAAGFSASTPGRRHRAHVSDSLIGNAVEPLEKQHGPVIDVQQLRYRSLVRSLRAKSRAAHSEATVSLPSSERENLAMGSRPQSSRAEASRRGFAQRPSPCLETTRHGNARPYCGPLCSPLQPRQGEMARRAEEDIICRTPKRRVPCRSQSPTPNRKPMTVRLRSRTIPTAIPHRCAFAKRLRPHRSGAQSENAPGRPGPMNAAVDNRRSRSME